MNFLDLKDIAEKSMDLVNPTTPEKLLKAGQIAGLKPGNRVIDFGCGYAESLILWAERFGISGVGIDIRPNACQRAEIRVAQSGLADRIEIVCGDAGKYPFQPNSYDVATCIGATFIWEGFGAAVQAMSKATIPGGRLVIGEAYWLTEAVPGDFRAAQTEIHEETQLLDWAHEAGYEFEYVLHSNRDEWDRYEASNWLGLVDWIETNPTHPERQQVIDHLHESQAEYLRYGSRYFGWGLYVLAPAKYLSAKQVTG